jgi:hypothetical protein
MDFLSALAGCETDSEGGALHAVGDGTKNIHLNEYRNNSFRSLISGWVQGVG